VESSTLKIPLCQAIGFIIALFWFLLGFHLAMAKNDFEFFISWMSSGIFILIAGVVGSTNLDKTDEEE